MVKRCARCGVQENEIRLFDAIYEGRMDNLCERCSIIENIPIIKKPNTNQLRESEQVTGVDSRLKTLSGIKEPEKQETFFREDRLRELEKNPQRELPEQEQLKLEEHYYWEIMKNRRRKGLTQKQLAEALGESEIAIQMIEKNKLPENVERLIKKLEQFFQVKLRKITETEKFLKEEEEEPILLDEEGQEIEIIPEPEQIIIEPEIEPIDENEIESYEKSREVEKLKEILEKNDDDESIFEEKYYPIIKQKNPEEEINHQELFNQEPLNDFNIRKANPEITINQLRELHRRKIEVTKQEQFEEQRKIEERQRILEALREKERLKKEQKLEKERIEKQNAEIQKQRLIQEKKQELEQFKKRESEEIDKYLGGSELFNKKSTLDLESQENIEEFDNELK